MAEAFLGLRISVLLHSGIKLEGQVLQIEPSTQQMTLGDVTLSFFGQPPHRTPVYGVIGKDIKDLHVLSAPTTTASLKNDSSKTLETLNSTSINPLNNHVLEQVPPLTPVEKKIMTPTTKPSTKNRKVKNSISQSFSNRGQHYSVNNNKRNENGWAGEDVNIFREEEFDFQKNLNMFDKAKIFAEIKESDETAPEELLVTLNRLPQKKVNLLPTENVLEIQKRSFITDDDDFGDESDNDSQTPDEYARRRRKSNIVKSKEKKNVQITTLKGGILCPSVSSLQMAHVEHECTKASSSFDELSIENGGRGSALLILQLLDNLSTSVTILIGDNKNGALGLVAARHLVNHGCAVNACIASNQNSFINKYEVMAKQFGVNIQYGTHHHFGKSDLIVDAILGADDKLIDIQDGPTYDSVCDTIHWANKQRTPILSIDFPSGMDASTGIPHHPEHVIRPKWTVCLGAPKTGCKSINITGELYLVDIGIPRLCWKRVGVKGNTIPWGADFLVALEYQDS